MTLTNDETSSSLCNSFTFDLSKLYMSMIITIGILCVISLLLFLWKKTDFSLIGLLGKRKKKRGSIKDLHYIHSNKVTEIEEGTILIVKIFKNTKSWIRIKGSNICLIRKGSTVRVPYPDEVEKCRKDGYSSEF